MIYIVEWEIFFGRKALRKFESKEELARWLIQSDNFNRVLSVYRCEPIEAKPIVEPTTKIVGFEIA